MRNFSIIIPDYASIVHPQQKNDRQIWFIAPNRSSNLCISSTAIKPDHTSKAFYGRAELDSHADTTVTGRNCILLHHTEISYDVAPVNDTYKTMKYVDIVSAATRFTSMTGKQYILVFNEELYMTELDHTLINRNQLS